MRGCLPALRLAHPALPGIVRRGVSLSAVFFGFASALLFAAEPPTTAEQAAKLYSEKHYDVARGAYESLARAEPTNADAAYHLGLLAIRQENADEAVTWLERATALTPANSEYQRTLGDAYGIAAQKAGFFSKMGLAKKCLAAYNRAVEIDPDNVQARISRFGYFRQAPSIVGGGIDKAYAEIPAIRQRDPRHADQLEGDLLLQDNKFDQAYALCRKLMDTGNPPAYALYFCGKLAASTGKYLEEGERSLKTYLTATRDPGDPPLEAAHWRLGMILEKKGNSAAARTEYEAALRLKADFKPAEDSLARLH